VRLATHVAPELIETQMKFGRSRALMPVPNSSSQLSSSCLQCSGDHRAAPSGRHPTVDLRRTHNALCAAAAAPTSAAQAREIDRALSKRCLSCGKQTAAASCALIAPRHRSSHTARRRHDDCAGATAAAAANGGGVRAAADEARHARHYEQVPWRSLQHGGNDGGPKTTQQP
jgi:hypothetical protein